LLPPKYRRGKDGIRKLIWEVPEFPMRDEEMHEFFRQVIDSRGQKHNNAVLIIEGRMSAHSRRGREVTKKLVYGGRSCKEHQYYLIRNKRGGSVFDALEMVKYTSVTGDSALNFYYANPVEKRAGWYVQGHGSENTLYNLACAIHGGKPLDESAKNPESVITLRIGSRHKSGHESGCMQVKKVIFVQSPRQPDTKEAREAEEDLITGYELDSADLASIARKRDYNPNWGGRAFWGEMYTFEMQIKDLVLVGEHGTLVQQTYSNLSLKTVSENHRKIVAVW
jgi:hypothetical protein